MRLLHTSVKKYINAAAWFPFPQKLDERKLEL